MKRIYLGIFFVFVALLGLYFFRQNQTDGSGKIQVVASIYPIAEVVRNVAGDAGSVRQIVTGGQEPHDYSPSPSDIVTIEQADLFVVNGLGMEPWAEKIESDLEQKGIIVLEAGQVVQKIKHDESEHQDEHAGEEEHASEEAGTEDHGHGSEYDPHQWLRIQNMILLTQAVQAQLQELDPQNAAIYQDNAAVYISKLEGLQQAYTDGLAVCSLNKAVVAHDAFGYLAEETGIEFISIAGLSPQDEPTPQQLAEIAEIMRETGITHIFYETLVSPKLSETLAAETGASTLVLNPLEGLTADQSPDTVSYISIMEENLFQLRTALQCQ
jgi:zinc transport system substrate-binding protein